MSFPLNPAQREAVRYQDGPLLVLAGAGSGKTRVIAAKIGHLIACGHNPQHVVAITFTNRAAREMRERTALVLAEGGRRGLADDVTLCTFHALGLKIIRGDLAAFALKPGFSILDPDDLTPIVADLIPTPDRGRTRAVQSRISAWKNALVSPAAAAKAAGNDADAAASEAYRCYDATLRAYQAVDFDDLIALPIGWLATNDAAAAKWRERYSHLLVDEFQDTNPAQYQLMKLLVGARGAFTAVGDDDQAIYGWRGASLDNLGDLSRDFPSLKVVALEQNYRSTVRILRSANALIANNPKLFTKRLWSELGHGDAIRVTPAIDDEAEAEGVVHRLLAHRFEHRGHYSDYAILYRGNHQAKLFEQQLRAQNVPYDVSGGQSYFDRAEIKDIVAYLRLIANDDDDPAFIRAVTTPRRGIGATTLERLGAIAGARHASLFAAVFAEERTADISTRQRVILDGFCAMINGFRYRAEREPAARLLDELVAAIGYEEFLCRDLRSQAGRGALEEHPRFHRLAFGEGRRGPQEFAGADADDRADHDARRAGRARSGLRAPVHAARSEGARIRSRVSGRARGGALAAPGVRCERECRRRAPTVLCRHHPRPAQRAPFLLPQASTRRRAGRMPAVALPRGARAGGLALGRNARSRRRSSTGERSRQLASQANEGDARGEVAVELFLRPCRAEALTKVFHRVAGPLIVVKTLPKSHAASPADEPFRRKRACII